MRRRWRATDRRPSGRLRRTRWRPRARVAPAPSNRSVGRRRGHSSPIDRSRRASPDPSFRSSAPHQGVLLYDDDGPARRAPGLGGDHGRRLDALRGDFMSAAAFSRAGLCGRSETSASRGADVLWPRPGPATRSGFAFAHRAAIMARWSSERCRRARRPSHLSPPAEFHRWSATPAPRRDRPRRRPGWCSPRCFARARPAHPWSAVR